MSGIFGFNVGAVISLGDLEKSIQLIGETEEKNEYKEEKTRSTEQIDRIERRFKLRDLPTSVNELEEIEGERETKVEATQDIFKELEEEFGEMEVSMEYNIEDDGEHEDGEFDDEDFGDFFQDDDEDDEDWEEDGGNEDELEIVKPIKEPNQFIQPNNQDPDEDDQEQDEDDYGDFFQDDDEDGDDYGDFFQDDDEDEEGEGEEYDTEWKSNAAKEIQSIPKEVQKDGGNSGEELEEDGDDFGDFFQDDEDYEEDYEDYTEDDEEYQEEHQKLGESITENIVVTPEEELKALVEEKNESIRDNELEEIKKQLENEKRLREKAEQEKRMLLKSRADQTNQGRTLTPEQIAKIRKIKQLREERRLQEEKRLMEETKPKEVKLDSSIYDSLDVEALYIEVKAFILKTDISKGVMDVKILRDKFGSNNIKKLITKSYLISIGKGVTIGK